MGTLVDDLYTTIVKHDSEGKRVPARLSGLQWLGPLLRGGLEPRLVPEEHWKPALRPFEAELACVCGEQHVLIATRLTKCQCGRWFVYAEAEVWSLLGPAGVHYAVDE